MFRLNNHYCTELINYEPRRIYESGHVVAREYNVSALYEGHVDSLYVCMHVCMYDVRTDELLRKLRRLARLRNYKPCRRYPNHQRILAGSGVGRKYPRTCLPSVTCYGYFHTLRVLSSEAWISRLAF